MLKSAFFKLSHLALRTSLPRPCWNLITVVENPTLPAGSEWLNAWSKSAAPSAPWVSLSKHLQCFVRINQDVWKATCAGTIHLKPMQVNPNSWDNFTNLYSNLNSDNMQQRQKNTRRKQENTSTISLCEAQVEICLLQVEPLGTTNFLPRCCRDLIAVTKNQLIQLCRLAQGFKQICGALCSFRVSVEAPAVFCQKVCQNTLGLRPVQVYNPSNNSDPYDNFTNLNSSIFHETDKYTLTGDKQGNLQPILSARHQLKICLSSSWSHLAPCNFCHAAAGIPRQKWRSKTSMGEELKHAISSIASESKSRATAILRRLGPANATLSPAAISSVEVEGVGHLAPSALSWSLCTLLLSGCPMHYHMHLAASATRRPELFATLLLGSEKSNR